MRMRLGGTLARNVRLACVALLLCVEGLLPGVAAASSDAYGGALGLSVNEIIEVTRGDSDPRGILVSSAPLAGFPREGTRFIIMSTGDAASAYLPDRNQAEVLYRGRSGDDISGILEGWSTEEGQDLVQLILNLRVPGWAQGLAFDFQFFTEEWPDFYGFPFNDTFLAQVGEQSFTINWDGGVTAPGNVAFDSNGNLISVNVGFGLDPGDPNPDTGTTYDGTTGLLTTRFPIPEGQNRITLTLSLFDAGDSIVDSAVFLDNFRFLREAPASPVTEQAGSGTAPVDLPTFGKITVGAGAAQGEGDIAFSGNLFAPEGGPARGHWTVVAEGRVLKPVKIDFVTFVADGVDGFDSPQAEYNAAYFEGAGLLNGLPGHTFRIWLTDRGEPGYADTFRVQVTAPDGTVVLDQAGTLQVGNLQIHPPGPR